MRRYYYNAVDGDPQHDAHGVDLPSDVEACQEALRRAESLISTREIGAFRARDWSMTVTDLTGALVLKLAIARTAV